MSYNITYSDLREHLKAALDKVCANNMPLLVTRRGGEDVVILSRADYDALEETAYLLRSPANARRLIQAMTSKRSDRHRFDSVKSLKHALGID